MKYLLRDEVLLKLGPVNALAPAVLAEYPPDGRFPIIQFAQAKEHQWVAVIGWQPKKFYEKSVTLATIVMTPDEYESLPEDDTLV